MSEPVRLSVAPDPANVRIARLVAVGAARDAGYPEPVVDDVRLAVGEACGRAVLAHLDGGVEAPIVVEVATEDGLTVLVHDADADAEPVAAFVWDDPSDGPVLDVEGAYVVDVVSILRGVADDLAVHRRPEGTTLELRWAPL